MSTIDTRLFILCAIVCLVCYALRRHATRQVFYAFRLSFSKNAFQLVQDILKYPPRIRLSSLKALFQPKCCDTRHTSKTTDRKPKYRHNQVKTQAKDYARKYQEKYRYLDTVTQPSRYVAYKELERTLVKKLPSQMLY